jgi:hypothetical protein
MRLEFGRLLTKTVEEFVSTSRWRTNSVYQISAESAFGTYSRGTRSTKDLLAVGAKVVLVVICDRIGRTLGGLKLYSCLLTAVAVDFCNLVLGVEHGVDIAGLGVVWEARYEDERALEVRLLGTGR